MIVAAHQEKKQKEKTSKREGGKERKQLTDFKRLRAALLRSFRGQQGKKMVCIRGEPGETDPSGG